MRKEHFSFVETSQDPVLTIAANAILKLAHLCLFSTMIFMMSSGAVKQPSAPNGEEHANLNQLKEKKESIEAEIRNLQEEKSRIESQAAAPAIADAGKRRSQREEAIAALKTDISGRTKYMESLQAELLGMQRSSSSPDIGKPGGSPAQLDQLPKDIEAQKRELGVLEIQIQRATERAAEIRGEQDKTKIEIARLQNEERAKRAELEKLKRDRSSLEPGTVIRGDVVFKTQKSKTVQLQLANNHLIPINGEYYEPKKSGYVTINSRDVKAVELCRKAGIQGDDVSGVGTATSILAKVLNKIDPKNERVLLLVNPNSFEMMRKAIEITSKRGIEVGWWPDSDESPCFITTGEGTGDAQIPSRRGQNTP